MGAHGITIAEECHIVNGLAPVDMGDVTKTSDYFSLKEYSHASIIITKGAGSATTITLYESQTIGGTVEATMAFDYYAETTAAGDTLGDRTAATTAGFAVSANSGVMYSIEVDASQLTDTYPYLAVKATTAATCLLAMTVILSGTRYQKENTNTAIT